MFGIMKVRRRGGAGKTTAQRIWETTLERLHSALLVGLCGAAVAVGSSLSSELALSKASADPQVSGPGQPQPAMGAPSALDAPLNLLAGARQTYQRVKDYSCTFITQERIKGNLEAEQVLAMKFRQQPFSVYMRWYGPREMVGQEVCYVQGRNQNKMRVHTVTGPGRLLGFITIDPTDPRVMEKSRHSIYEAGVGNLINTLTQGWQQERQLNKTKVSMAEYEYNKRRCIRVEAVHTERLQQFTNYRSVVYFDKETQLPVRVESYDWPRQGGPVGGDLMEGFSYIDLQFNVGLTDQVFNK